MNRSAKKQRHEQARKQHKHDSQQHARELAKQPRANVGLWLLGGVVAAVLAVVVLVVIAR
ncbi:MAG: hypothetical protein K2X87_17605 [Gemmataceae bacterium]|nr:hypothetical protein [Gemmataceae bacterium]